MAFGVKTNERPGTRAEVRYVRMSAYKAREVLDLIRGKEVQQADEILQFCRARRRHRRAQGARAPPRPTPRTTT